VETDRHVDDLIPSYVLGALTAEEAEHVRAHLAVCAACLRTAEAAKEVAATVSERAHTDVAGRCLPGYGAVRPRSGWARVLLHAVPWTVAVIGWLVAAGFIAYSHGQSDRLRTTRHTFSATIDSLQRQVLQANEVQGYLSTPNIQIVTLYPPHPNHWQASVTLLLSPHYATALLVARGLPALPPRRVYGIWIRGDGGLYIRLGTLTISGARREGVAVVVGPRTFEHFTSVELTVEASTATGQPTAPVICRASIAPVVTR
jgi:hypothetical protein